MTDAQAKVAELDLHLKRDGSGMWLFECRRMHIEETNTSLTYALADAHDAAAREADKLHNAGEDNLSRAARKRLAMLTALCDALIELQAGGK